MTLWRQCFKLEQKCGPTTSLNFLTDYALFVYIPRITAVLVLLTCEEPDSFSLFPVQFYHQFKHRSIISLTVSSSSHSLFVNKRKGVTTFMTLSLIGLKVKRLFIHNTA